MILSKEHKSLFVICIALGLCYFKFNAIVFLLLALTILIVGLLLNNFRNLLHKGWMGLAELLSRFIQPIMLSVLFYIVLTPIAILQRLFTKHSFGLKNNSTTTFKNVTKTFTSKYFENPW